MKNKIIIILVALAITTYFFLPKDFFSASFPFPQSSIVSSDRDSNTILIGNTKVFIEIADTDEEKTLGLSGRAGLAENSGMLFVFSTPTDAKMWMKDMFFPIDMVWIDKNLKIVGIKQNATPESFPEVFGPEEKSLYVIELPANFVEKHFIKIGDSVKM